MTKTTSKYYLNLIQFISIGILLTFQNCSEPLPNLVSNINNTSENDSSNNLQTHLSDLKFKTTNQINGDLKTEFNIDESIYREVSPLGRDSLVCQTKIDNESACLNLNNFKSMTERGWTFQNILGGKWIKLNKISESDNLKTGGVFLTFFYDPDNGIIKRVKEFKINLMNSGNSNEDETKESDVENNNNSVLTISQQDPGHSVPVWKPTPNLIVFNPSQATREFFVPRCIPTPNQSSKICGYKQGGFFDTMLLDQVWSMRMYFTEDESADLQFKQIHLARTETGEPYNSFEAALSDEPGVFDVESGCKGLRITYYNDKFSTFPENVRRFYRKNISVCPLISGKRYYLNIKSTNKVCNSQFGCRIRVVYYEFPSLFLD